MDVLDRIIATARAACPRIVLSEGDDPRVVEAALRAEADGLARIALVGTGATLAREGAGRAEAGRIAVHDPTKSPHLDDYAARYHNLRRHKGVDIRAAREAMADPLGFAAMMVRAGDADGTIGGAVATTADTVRTALQIIGRAPDADVVSSFFLMLLRAPFERPVIFADCGLIIEPTVEELASLAIASAASMRAMTGEEARVALLSFSTKGSVPASADPAIGRIHEALALVRERAPELVIDGELQFDAAVVPDIAARKAPGAALQGDANVFIFPNLNAGNIGYKIAQRIGGAVALGPILQGLARPANDLSRGCSAEDVYQMIAITAAQAAADAASREAEAQSGQRDA